MNIDSVLKENLLLIDKLSKIKGKFFIILFFLWKDKTDTRFFSIEYNCEKIIRI